jgi:hypothetical protein
MITRCGCLSSTASITVSPRLHPVKLIHNLFYQQPCLGRAGKAGTHRRKSSDRTCGGGDLKPTFQTQFRGFEADLPAVSCYAGMHPQRKDLYLKMPIFQHQTKK